MPNYCYFRIRDPNQFVEFRNYKSSSYEGKPIYLTIGRLRGSEKWVVQRVMYPKGHPLCPIGGREITRKAMRDYIMRKYGSRAKYVLKQRGLEGLLEALDIRIPQDLTPLGKTLFYGALAGTIYLIYKLVWK